MYRVDKSSKKLIPLIPTLFSLNGLKERYDIQEWIEKNPEILEEDILIIQKEYILPSGKRLDLLAIDRQSRLVILELKRDESGDSVEWQAIKYASYCSRFSQDEIVEIYSRYIGSDIDDAESRIENFVDNFNELNQEQRIIMVSKDFHSDVASAAFWLREKYGLDIKCVKLLPFIDSNGDMFLEADVIIPLKEMEDYIVSNAKKNTVNRSNTETEWKSSYYSNIGDYNSSELKEKLIDLIEIRKNTIVCLIPFLKSLINRTAPLSRDEFVNILVELGFSDAGRKVNKVSQILTKKSSDALRQVIDYDGKQAGTRKDNFRLKEEYKGLLGEILEKYT